MMTYIVSTFEVQIKVEGRAWPWKDHLVKS